MIEKKSLTGYHLKLIALITMLIDHIGYEIVYPILFVSAPAVLRPDGAYRLYLLCRSDQEDTPCKQEKS